jgi:hypothetical protein
MKTTLFAFALLLATPVVALAQEEDDHAVGSEQNRSKGTEPGPLRMAEAETPVAGQGADKTFGIGFGQTVGGVTGLEVEYYLSNIMLNAHFGFLFFSPDGGDSASSFAFAAGGFYRWRVWDNVAVMLGGRLGIGHVSAPDAGELGAKPQVYASGDTTQINIEVPLRAQIYFADILAVHAEVGPVLSIVGDGGNVLGSYSLSKGTYLHLPLTTLLASFGVTLYFE